ncbi:aminoglycoside phosphotransferase family protein [bacterium]|nr:aminoglycoside phosphotransferase family protein [bacterium]MBU1025808.1 aminoglycoside phosphotransferase family protein [bacterium]
MSDIKVIERIIKHHSSLFGNASVTDISVFETASFNMIFFFQCGSRSYVLKVLKKDAKKEFQVMKEAEKHIAVPSALSYGEIDDDEYLLMERAQGKDAQTLLNTMDKIKRAGFVHYAACILAKLHRSTLNIQKPDSIPISNHSLVDDLNKTLTRLGVNDWSGISTLKAMEPRVPDETCLAHGRFFPTNLLLDKSGISCVIDWAASTWSSPLIDLGRTLFVFSSLGLDASLFLRSYLDERFKLVITANTNNNSVKSPDDIIPLLPFYETYAAIEFYIFGIKMNQDPKLYDVLHSPQYAWLIKSIQAADTIAGKL